ncbi:MAG: hypothetical protein MUP85_25610 [Candidatus Lokiarchaeota archaeon]|nr:hypothetical protein [Candidatus Lokiarchaeota archaeon]
MKKTFNIIASMFLFSGIVHATTFSIELKGSYFSPSEKAFQDIYGGGITYGGEVAIGLWKNLQFWLGGNYYSGNGGLTYTGEATSLKILPIGGGLKYELSSGILGFYGGVGVNYYQYKESSVIGNVNEGKIGFIGKLGLSLNVTKGLFIDLFVNYSYCEMTPADFTINIGGFDVGGGLGYKF